MLSDVLRKILTRRQAYRRVFQVTDGIVGNRDAEQVLADLARFCNFNEPTTRVSPVSRTIDPLAMAQAEGRREVFLRINKFLHVSDADLARMQEQQQERTEE
jgi:hypothetical protein